MKRALPVSLVLGVHLVGCADPQSLPALEYESSRARIGVTREELAPCGADLERIDRQVAFVEELMRLPARGPLEVFIMDIDELPCGEGSWGCYRAAKNHVYSPWFAIEHELAHAALVDIDFPSTFWREGNAELLAGTRGTRRDPSVVLTPERLDANQLANYAEATHFQRYLVETRGWERYAELVRGGFDVEAVYGMTPGELTAEYEAEAPAGYPPLDACAYPSIGSVGDGRWEAEVTFSCADSSQLEGHSFSNDVGAAVHRMLWLDAGTYEVRQEGGAAVFIEGCWIDVLDELPIDVPSNGDVPNEADQGSPFPFEAEITHTLVLTDGLYRFSLGSGTEREATVTLTVRRIE